MKTYWERTEEEKDLINKAYRYEVEAIESLSTERNPYKDKVRALEDGYALWEYIEEALEMAYN